MASELVRGAPARFQFLLFNPGAEEIEIVTAAGNGSQPSPQVRFKLIDLDGHVLATLPVQVSVGASIVNLTDGTSVLRLPAGAQVLAEPVSYTLPVTTPRRLVVRVELDKVYYHRDREDQVEMNGVQTAQEFAVIETSYTAEVTSVTPPRSNGEQPVTLAGNAWYRVNHQPAAGVPVLVKIANGGFERSESILTAADGSFSTTFTPLPGEAGGIYSVWAVHPDLSDRLEQATFAVERVLASPSQFGIRAPHYYVQPVPITVTAGPGTLATNVHFEFRPQDQPSGALPAGVTVGLGATVATLTNGQSAPITLTFTGTPTASSTGSMVLFLTSDNAGTNGWQRIPVSYAFSEAFPSLRWTPNLVETGVAPSNTVSETVTLENVGLVSATNLTFSLVNLDGTPARAWASLTVQTNLAELKVGDRADLGLLFQPLAGTPEGDYLMTLRIRAGNYPNVDLGVHVAVVTSGLGGALFKVVDMFTGSNGTNFLGGVPGARIRLQNEQVTSIETNLVVDTLGEAWFRDLPAGLYKYQVTADKHNSSNGRLWIRAGTTVNQQVALDYTLVTVTWEVVPITIEDRYEIILNAVFETDVPAAVITLQPGAINLPQLFAGDVYLGELVLENHGLIRAEDLTFSLPESNEYFDYETLAGVPATLNAKQKVRIPYRIVCKLDMPGPNQRSTNAPPVIVGPGARAAKAATPANCYSYRRDIAAAARYRCVNGLWFQCGAGTAVSYSYTRGCPGDFYYIPAGIYGNAPGGWVPTTWGTAFIPPWRGPECFPLICPAAAPQAECQSCSSSCGGGTPSTGFPSGGPSSGGPSDGAPTGGGPRERAGSWVSLINREYQDEVEDLSFKVPGGTLKAVRQFYQNDWRWVDIARRLTFNQGIQGLTSIENRLVKYYPVNTAKTVFQYSTFRILKTADGWRWESRDGTWENYDANGLLLSSGRRNVTLARYAYDGSGRLAAVTDAAGQPVFAYEYAGPLLSAISDRSGRRISYTWANGHLTGMRDVLGRDATYTYDGAGRLTQKTDVNGNVTLVTYDGGGYVYSVLDGQGNGKYFTYTYDPNNRQYYAQVRTTGGQIMEKRFASDAKTVSQANNGTLQQTFLRDGRSELETSASGAITRRDYDEWDNVIRETRPDGGITTWEFSPGLNKPYRMVDPRGAVTLLSYDANANLTNRIEAAGTAIARTNSWLYDSSNLLVRRIDARGNRMDYTYDANGNPLSEYDPSNPAYQTLYAYDLRGNRIAVTNALGYATLYDYDALDRLIAETNALGHVTLYTYQGKNLVEIETGRDGANRGRIIRYRYDTHDRRTQTVRVDGEGQEHVWETTTYDTDGRVVAVANALGQTRRFTYSTLGQRVKIARPFSATETSDVRFEYDDAGRPVRAIDPLVVLTQTEYDALGRVRKVTEALGTSVQRSRERGYDLAGNLTSLTYSDGTNAFTTLYTYDLLNRRTQIRGAREYPRDFEYDENDNLTAQVNGRGYRAEYGYDAYSRRTNSVKGSGHGEPGEHADLLEYDLLGQVLARYDGNGNHRHYHYDALGRQTEQSIPLAPTNSLPTGDWWTDNAVVLDRTWFNPWGQPVATSNILGGVTTTVYDAWGRRFTHTDAAGLTLTNEFTALDQLSAINYPPVSSAPPGSPPTAIRYSYDAYNAQMLVSTTDRANLTTRYGYDKRFHRASELTSWGALTTYRTDELGRQTGVTNALNEVTQSDFDQFNQLVATIFADHIPITQERIEYRAYDEYGKMTNHWGAATYDAAYTYDIAGNQVSLTDGNGNTTRWEYDGRNRKVRKIYADNNDYEYTYDAEGNRTRKRDAMQRTTRYEFNAYNLLVRTGYPNDPDVTFGYDPAGHRVLMVDGTGTNTWCYDAANRVLTNTQFNVQHAVSYTYDAEGSRLAMTITPLPAGASRTTDYAYDGAGRLVTIIDHGVSESPFLYAWATNASHLTSLDYPSGLRTSHAYDALGRKTMLSTLDASQVEIARFAYAHDRAGQRTSETTLDHTDQFAYDGKRQLLAARRFFIDGTSDPAWNFACDYDPIGNRKIVTDPDGVHYYTANIVNQYSSITNAAAQVVTYDGNGNCLGTAQSRYRFDDNDRLAEASNATVRASFRYDGIGRRVVEQGTAPLASDMFHLVYDDLLTVGRLSGHDSQTSWVTRGLDFSLSRDGLGGIAGLLATSIAGEATHLITDGRGNIRFTADRPPTRIREFEYQPFGVAFGIGNEHKSFGFSSKEQFNDLQLVDFGRRFYLPSIGRWLARDPVEEADGINLYAFVRNDPINEVDPYGLACFKKRPLGPNTAPKWFEKWVAPWWNPSLGDYLDWATEHEHIFYEDGTDVGCFPEGPHPDRATNYESQDCGYNDCVLRKAVQAVPCRGYDLMFNNCQDWASDVRGKYQSLMNDCSVSTGCGVFCVPPAFRQGVPGWVPPM